MRKNRVNQIDEIFLRAMYRSVRRLQRYLNRKRTSTWLECDRYILLLQCRFVLAGLKNRAALAPDKGLLAAACSAAWKVSEAMAPDADTDDMLTLFKESGVDEVFLRVFPLLRAGGALLEIEKYKDAAHAPVMYDGWISILHGIRNIDWLKIHGEVSVVENHLFEDPSGTYPHCDQRTQNEYRNAILEKAKKSGKTEEETAKDILIRCKNATTEEGRMLSFYLFRKHQASHACIPHIIFYLSAILFSLLVFLYFLSSGVTLALVASCLLLLPFYMLVRVIADAVVMRFVKKRPVLRLSLEKIPEGSSVLTVVTTLLRGKASDEAIYQNLERFYLRNREKNIYYGILGDLSDSHAEETEGDTEIMHYAIEQIRHLNEKYGEDRFCLFIRKRTYLPSDNKYSGWERKRGALIDLVRYLRRGDHADHFRVLEAPTLVRSQKIRYVCSLDSDTEILPGGIRDMLSVFLHPHNKAVIRDGCIREGIGIVQPSMTVSLSAATATYFTLLCTGKGGIDPYYRFRHDSEGAMFGIGSFCGKGMFDADAFLTVLEYAFPENAVLSHDFLEGTRLGCANLPDVTFVDSIPRNALSYFQRQSRWVRGDTQVLRFSFSSYRNTDGCIVKNPIRVVERLRCIDHFLYAAVPIAVLRAVLLFAFFSVSELEILLLFSFCYGSALFRPLLLLGQRYTLKTFFRRFFGIVLTDLRQSVLWVAFRIQFTAYEGWVNLKAIIVALMRMLITHRGLLSWTTAAESEQQKGKGTLWGTYRSMRSSVFMGVILLFSSFWIAKILGVVWILAPYTAWKTASPIRTRKVDGHTKSKDRETHLKYHRDMWQYFVDHVNEETQFLPPDNIQFFPSSVPVVAQRTSPTNIGLYLLSCISACDCHLISASTLADRLELTLKTLKRMKRFRGHYYNWYDTTRAERIGSAYISTVDSGNLACCLVTAAQGVLDYAPSEVRLFEISNTLMDLANAMDFSFLYDEKKQQLHLGYDTESQKLSNAYYDLYASEARSAVFYAIARSQIPANAWWMLGRPVTERKNRIGILSWSGSVFEYFMPMLWLPNPDHSLCAESLFFAAAAQYADSTVLECDGVSLRVFGRSEGARFEFDAERNFQYGPCGAHDLAMDPGIQDSTIVMPYALFLMMPFAYDTHIDETLWALRSIGMYGNYGFYEALDMTPKRVGSGWAVIRSYMAHHVGMSLISLGNLLNEGVFMKRFMREPTMDAMRILLEEAVPADAIEERILPSERMASAQIIRRKNLQTENTVIKGSDTPVQFAILSNTRALLVADSKGHIMIRVGDIAVTVPDFLDVTSIPPMFFYTDAAGEVYVPCSCMSDVISKDASFLFSSDETYVRYEGIYTDGVTAVLLISMDAHTATFSFKHSLWKDGNKISFSLTHYFRPVLMKPYAYAVHRTFADLFLISSWNEHEKRLLVQRRPRSEHEKNMELCVFAAGLEDVRASTDAFALLPLHYHRKDLTVIEPISHSTHQVSSSSVPMIALWGRSNGESVIYLSVGERVSDLGVNESALRTIREEHRLLCGNLSPMDATLSRLLGALHERRRTSIVCGNVKKGYHGEGKARFWKYGISGDLPIVIMIVGEAEEKEGELYHLLMAWKYLLLSGVLCDLVFVVTERDAYEQPCSALVEKYVESCGLKFFLQNRIKGGLHIVSHDDAKKDMLFSCAADIFGKPNPIAIAWERVKTHEVKHDAETISYQMDEKRILIHKGKQLAPWTYMLTNGVFGTLVSSNHLGFTFFTNSRECRVTPWYGDILSERCGEHLYAVFDGEDVSFDLCLSSQKVLIEAFAVHYIGKVKDVLYRVSVTVPDRRKKKCISIHMENDGSADQHVCLRYEIEPLMGVVVEDRECIVWEKDGESLIFTSMTNPICSDYYGILSMEGAASVSCGQNSPDTLYVESKVLLQEKEKVQMNAYLSVKKHGERETALSLAVIKPELSPIIRTGSAYFDALANTWLPLQIMQVRLFGRCGFYQPGGAYGFRDQLQDAMALVKIAPYLLERQIYRAAAHQYVEGDVQHWWHPLPCKDPAKSHKGVRTRCSDDLLWLPLAVSYYISATGDVSILEKEIRYIQSPVLGEEENERYEEPLRSSIREDVYMHCVRAIEHSMHFGIHGLPLMGIGDWNDGMNKVGNRGQGESVFCGMFLLLVLYRFIDLCRIRGDESGIEAYTAAMKQLSISIESEAWNGQWYRRAWYDDGYAMGDPGQSEAEIDLLPQAFAAILNHQIRIPGYGKPFDQERVESAMRAAYDKLYDPVNEIFALLSPPFSKKSTNTHDPGYISGYIPGTRENGGQYTHAAVWGAMGLFAIGEHEKGMRIVRALSPVRHTSSEERILRYRKEPYALCGDILMAEGRIGEGGWSQYTGSAGWYYRLLCELFGDCQ